MASRSPHHHRDDTTLSWIGMGSFTAILVGIFSTYFPFVADFTFGKMSRVIYQNAWYNYDERSKFDNTALTYATDYLIAAVMVGWVVLFLGSYPSVCNSSSSSNSSIRTGSGTGHHIGRSNPEASAAVVTRLEDRQTVEMLWKYHLRYSKGLLLAYALSVLSGAIAHQFYTTTELLNTRSFRFLWTVCVGSVTAAAGWMGSIASVWAQHDKYFRCSVIPVIPVSFWAAYATVGTAVVVAGGWSYQRPAADIFVAGITQFPSTFYIMALLWKGMPTLNGLCLRFRKAGMLAFILNAILLPIYPAMINMGWSLGVINCLLHSWLLLSWSAQAYVLGVIGKALVRSLFPPDIAVPFLKNQQDKTLGKKQL